MQADRLVSLTYALEDAIVRRDWQVVDAIFSERGKLLASRPVLDPARVTAIQEADRRLMMRLEIERGSILAKLKRTRQVSAARKTYLRR